MPDLLGQVIAGRFRIESQLGGGAMGEVFLAEHLMLGRRYAIKVLRESVEGDHRLAERFRREARAASKLDHPNIVSIMDFGRTEPTQTSNGTEPGRLYLVMEHIDGASLAQAISETKPKRLPQQRSVLILSQLCSAVKAAHDEGVVHRDLKPDNILLGRGPSGKDIVKVLDFGLAKMMQNPTLSQLTRRGEIFGTPAYMSPEQALGTPVDHRADIYSVGVIAYELFAGRLPFVYNTLTKLLIAHQQEQPAPPSQHLRPGETPIPQDIERAILCCMAKDPAARLQSVDELNAVLGGYAQRISILGTRVVPNVVVQAGSASKSDSDWCEVTFDAGSFASQTTALGDALLEEALDQEEASLRTHVSFEGPQPAGHGSTLAFGSRGRFPKGASRDWFWGQVVKNAKDLAEVLERRHLGREDLSPVLSKIEEQEDKVLTLESDIALARSRIDELESMTREVESRLRFAVMDLSMERGRLMDEGKAAPRVLQDLDYQIQAMEGRLLELYNTRSQKHSELAKSIEAREQHLTIYRQRQVDAEVWLLNQLHRARPKPCPEDLSQHYHRLEELLHGLEDAPS